MKLHRRPILFGLLFLLPLLALMRDDKLDAIMSYLERLRSDYPTEKVHLHLDKPYYSIGEDIWFKAYVVNGEKNELSSMSKILYVDVVDERDS